MRRLLGVATALFVVVAACTPTETERGKPRPNGSTPTHPSPTGGTVDVGIVGEPPTLDPYSRRATDLTFALVRPVYPSLFRLDPLGVPVPDLARSIRGKPSGAVVVELKETRWSNGTPIRARDVVASVARARPPSGFTGLEAKAVGPRKVLLAGAVRNWELTLARTAFVLPDGRAKRRISGGPLRIERRVPGLKIVYRARPGWGPVNIERLRVFSYLDSGSLRDAVGSGDVDVAVLPSTVNLVDRIDDDVELHRAVGWETVWLDLSHAGLTEDQRLAVAAAVDRVALEEGFIRDDGRVSDTLNPAPGAGGAEGDYSIPKPRDEVPDLSLSIPEGDELLSLVRRAVQLQLAPNVRVDLVTLEPSVFYGTPDVTRAVRLVRSAGAPAWSGRDRKLDGVLAMPLFHVATFALSAGVEGIEVNPTFEGLLWNVERWRVTPAE